MAQGQSHGNQLVGWYGEEGLAKRVLASAVPVVDLCSLESLPAGLSGVCLGDDAKVTALSACSALDGLAGAIGQVDTLATAGVPGLFGFSCRVQGIVAAYREATGRVYAEEPASILGSGPEAWAALAALTQLRVTKLTHVAPARDAMTGAIAHRLGIEPAVVPADSAITDGLVFDADRLTFGPASAERIVLHTVAAQIRLLTSRDVDIEELGAVLRN